jgi:hypothetical protein
VGPGSRVARPRKGPGPRPLSLETRIDSFYESKGIPGETLAKFAVRANFPPGLPLYGSDVGRIAGQTGRPQPEGEGLGDGAAEADGAGVAPPLPPPPDDSACNASARLSTFPSRSIRRP